MINFAAGNFENSNANQSVRHPGPARTQHGTTTDHHGSTRGWQLDRERCLKRVAWFISNGFCLTVDQTNKYLCLILRSIVIGLKY